jgi:lipopolysaccharide biosynthesis glycosyltransferase
MPHPRFSILASWTATADYYDLACLSVFTFLNFTTGNEYYQIKVIIFFMDFIPESFNRHLTLFRSSPSGIPVDAVVSPPSEWTNWSGVMDQQCLKTWTANWSLSAAFYLNIPFKYEYDYFFKMDADTVVIKPFFHDLFSFARLRTQCFFGVWNVGRRIAYVNTGVVLFRASVRLFTLLKWSLYAISIAAEKFPNSEQDPLNLYSSRKTKAMLPMDFNHQVGLMTVEPNPRIYHFIGKEKRNPSHRAMVNRYKKLLAREPRLGFQRLACELGPIGPLPKDEEIIGPPPPDGT